MSGLKHFFKRPFFLTILLLGCYHLSIGQGVGINEDGAQPDASALLDVTSTSKGVLIPRMSSSQRTLISNPATGLLVFDTDEANFWFFNGTAWEALDQVNHAFQVASNLVSPHDNNVGKATDDFVFGSTQLDDDGNSSHDSRFFFDKSKGAFRAGRAISSQWDESNVGNYSTAWGYSNIASGNYSAAWGLATEATGNQSTAWGYYTNAVGVCATAWGRSADAIGDYSTAWGYSNNANGGYSTAWGYLTEADGDYATTWGYLTDAEGNYATAWGQNTDATGNYATAWGQYTDATGVGSTAWGYYTEAPSYLETTFGRYNTIYTPNSTNGWNENDRLLVIGNGSSYNDRSDALVIYKNGTTELNGNLAMNGNWLSNDGDNEGVYVTTSGRVGIGTSSPNSGKFQVSGTTSKYFSGSYSWLTSGGSIRTYSANSQDVSIYASGIIAGFRCMSHSDQRIKTDLVRTNNEADLATLMKVKVTDYAFVDKTEKGDLKEKKVIAQELKEVYPQAVTDNITQVVPDIMQFAPAKSGWISLDNHGLTKGELVRLVHKTGAVELEVLEVTNNSFKVDFKGEEQLLVYGRQVNDFHTVDYDAVAMLNVSATQAQQKRIEQLEQENQALKSKVQDFETYKSSTENRLEKLEALLQHTQTATYSASISKLNNNESNQ